MYLKNYNRLDAAAKLFPSVTSKNNSSVFRVSVVMREEVDPKTLQLAVNIIYERFSMFFLRLRRGVFWNYFDTNYSHFRVEAEGASPCSSIFANENNGHIIKVLYHKNRISVETFHAVTDGTGVLEFMKSLVYYYLCIKHGQIDAQNKVMLFNDISKIDEDSFSEHFGKTCQMKREKTPKSPQAFRISGKKFRRGGHSVVTGIVSVEELKTACKQYSCTITALLIATAIFAIYEQKQSKIGCNKPIVVAVPVNLRKLFASNTLKNFFGVVNVGYTMSADTSFSELVEAVSEILGAETKQKQLKIASEEKLSLSKNIFSRHIPLVVKNMVMPIGFNFMAELKKTISISNVSQIDMPDGVKPHIEQMEILFYPTKKSPINCAVCSFEDRLSINFTRSIRDASVVRAFFTTLAEHTGVSVAVYSNMWGDSNEKM